MTEVPPVYALRRREAGGHVDLTVFAAPHPDQTYRNLGTLTGSPVEMDRICELLKRAAPSTIVDRGEAPSITRWFTFGFDHEHRIDGFTYDHEIVVEITAPDPRAVMVETFGRRWAFEYRYPGELDMVRHYPRGMKVLER